jgi:hypothetical protein
VGGHGARRAAFDVEREGRDPPVHRVQAVERAAVGQAVEEPLAQLALVRLNALPADRVDVLDRGDEAREQLVGERPRLEAMPERLVGCRANLERPPPFEQLCLAEREPQVGPVELERRTLSGKLSAAQQVRC